MSSKRQQIVDAVKARFAAITAAGGYQTDIGLKQTEWHTTAKEAADLPGHDVRDETEEAVVPELKNSSRYDRLLQITVVAEIVEADATAARARAALADMIRAVGADPLWGGLARRTLPVAEEVTVDNSGLRIGSVRLTFKVEYSRGVWEA